MGIVSSFQALQGGASEEEAKNMFQLLDNTSINFEEQFSAAKKAAEKTSSAELNQQNSGSKSEKKSHTKNPLEKGEKAQSSAVLEKKDTSTAEQSKSVPKEDQTQAKEEHESVKPVESDKAVEKSEEQESISDEEGSEPSKSSVESQQEAKNKDVEEVSNPKKEEPLDASQEISPELDESTTEVSLELVENSKETQVVEDNTEAIVHRPDTVEKPVHKKGASTEEVHTQPREKVEKQQEAALKVAESTNSEVKQEKRIQFLQEVQQLTKENSIKAEVLKEKVPVQEKAHIELPLHRFETDRAVDILNEIEDLAQNMLPQKSTMGKVSQKIMDTLSEKNTQNNRLNTSARISSLNGEGLSLDKKMEMKSLSKQSEGKQTQKATYEDPRMERLRARVLEQVRFQVKLKLNGQVNEALLKLKPDMLGSVSVKMQMEGKQVYAHFIVETQTVKDILQRDLSSLQDALTERGFEVNGVEVSVSQEQATEGKGGRAFHSHEDISSAKQWVGSFYKVGGQEEVEATTEERSSSDPNQTINIVV
jgi:flagellar hook-length control protein FliK